MESKFKLNDLLTDRVVGGFQRREEMRIWKIVEVINGGYQAPSYRLEHLKSGRGYIVRHWELEKVYTHYTEKAFNKDMKDLLDE